MTTTAIAELIDVDDAFELLLKRLRVCNNLCSRTSMPALQLARHSSDLLDVTREVRMVRALFTVHVLQAEATE